MQTSFTNMNVPINIPTICSLVAFGVITTIGTFYLLAYRKKQMKHVKWIEVGKVSKLFVYPLKSGRRIEVEKADTTPVGFVTMEENGVNLRDRSFVVYGESNKEFKTARTYPTLLKIECLPHDKDHVVFDAPDQRPLYVKIPDRATSKPFNIGHHGDEKIETLDCGDEAAAWISKYLNKPNTFRIGYHDGEFKRDIKKIPKAWQVYKNLNSESMGLFSDICAFHLINESSIEKLNSELEEPITANNYRPNILVTGKIPAFSEEDWHLVKIGNAVFKNARPSTRCVLTTINPDTAEFSKMKEPLKTLQRLNVLKDPEHIASEGKAPVMGIYLGLIEHDVVTVGDTVYISVIE